MPRSYTRKPKTVPAVAPYAPVAASRDSAARDWSHYQSAIFADVATGTGHTVVIARAGSGKTSTIVEAFHHVPGGLSILMCAFNKNIATELATRAPGGVEVSTLHSLGFKACGAKGIRQVDNRKLDRHVLAVAGGAGSDEDWRELAHVVAKLTSLAKSTLSDDSDAIDDLLDVHGIDTDATGQTRETIVDLTIKVLAACKADLSCVDFDDMIWFPNVLGFAPRKFDRVFIDETQDLNAGQIALALAACRPGGRILAVGDDRQAIYGFRGADSQAIANVVESLSAKVLPLSVTYRCARAIVAVAQEIVPDLEAAPNAAEGTVERCERKDLTALAAKGDFILSRTNAPLIGLALRMLAAGTPCQIQGRDIGANLSATIKNMKARDASDLGEKIVAWGDKETARLAKANRDTDAVADRVECILTLSEGASTVADVTAKIERLFADSDSRAVVTLSTTHKAKGLERDRAFLLTETYKPSKGIEEANLWYVAVTRAKRDLRLVNPK